MRGGSFPSITAVMISVWTSLLIPSCRRRSESRRSRPCHKSRGMDLKASDILAASGYGDCPTSKAPKGAVTAGKHVLYCALCLRLCMTSRIHATLWDPFPRMPPHRQRKSTKQYALEQRAGLRAQKRDDHSHIACRAKQLRAFFQDSNDRSEHSTFQKQNRLNFELYVHEYN